MRTVPKIDPSEWPLSVEEAVKRGFFTVQLRVKQQEYAQAKLENETNNYRSIKGKPGTTRRYLIRFPGVNAVRMVDAQFFMHDVSCMKDAKKLARKGGEGTVIQMWTEKLCSTRIGKTTIVTCVPPKKYTFLKLIDGKFQPYTPAKMRLADQQGAN